LNLTVITPGQNELIKSSKIFVDNSGSVSRQVCHNSTDRRCDWEEIGAFSRSEVRQIQNLIEEAKAYSLEKMENDSFCLVQPIGRFSYRAENDTLILGEGTKPCGEFYRNNSEAAKELKRILIHIKTYGKIPHEILD
jgi:hypothetical protein